MKTIKINNQYILIALLHEGFDRIDQTLIDTIKDRALKLEFTVNGETAKFEYYEDEISQSAMEYLDFDYVYTLKNGLSLDSDINYGNRTIKLAVRLEYLTETVLIQFIRALDIREILADHISRFPDLTEDIFLYFLSSKERKTALQGLFDNSKRFKASMDAKQSGSKLT